MSNYDFSGWATRNDIKCSDGRTIRKDAFIANDGKTVPLVWNHDHNTPTNVLGHALLENRDEGVYAYGTFNDTEDGQAAKQLVMHGDITALSIYANKLKQNGGNVIHGAIREVSLVLAGANPGAYIDSIMAHGDDNDEEAIIYNPEEIILHSDEEESHKEPEQETDLAHSDDEKKEDVKMAEETKETKAPEASEKTVQDVIDSMNEEQKNVLYALVGQALEEKSGSESEGGEGMKHNVFEGEEMNEGTALCHADEVNIINLAKQSNVGSFQQAIAIYAEENEALSHGFVDGDGENAIGTLFPEFEDTNKGTPNTLTRDQDWVAKVMSGVHKSPISRIRTRHADARAAELRAKGYQKPGDKKQISGDIKLLSRTTDPQTVYRKDQLNRDDIIDITDFDVVAYQWANMKRDLNEEIATAILIGDGRDEEDTDKIHEEHIRSIYHDADLYTIHADIDYEGAKAKLQGANTAAQFGEEYIKAEATIAAALYTREKYKGSGNLTYFCTPHSLNVMLLARDLNGRRIYNSVSDLAAALNVSSIQTVEQFEGVQREDAEHQKHNLVGLFVNLSDYQVGATKGGEITQFDQFDINFNQYKYLIETRISGALTKVYSAIALEEKAE